jgi:hypothetical protein
VEAYDRAKLEAEETLAFMDTKGWKVRVWENMGWHWCLTNKLCGLSLHNSTDIQGLTFWCMMADGDSKNCYHGSCGFQSTTDHFKNPNLAVRQAIRHSLPYFEAQARGLANLKSIVPKRR